MGGLGAIPSPTVEVGSPKAWLASRGHFCCTTACSCGTRAALLRPWLASQVAAAGCAGQRCQDGLWGARGQKGNGSGKEGTEATRSRQPVVGLLPLSLALPHSDLQPQWQSSEAALFVQPQIGARTLLGSFCVLADLDLGALGPGLLRSCQGGSAWVVPAPGHWGPSLGMAGLHLCPPHVCCRRGWCGSGPRPGGQQAFPLLLQQVLLLFALGSLAVTDLALP